MDGVHADDVDVQLAHQPEPPVVLGAGDRGLAREPPGLAHPEVHAAHGERGERAAVDRDFEPVVADPKAARRPVGVASLSGLIVAAKAATGGADRAGDSDAAEESASTHTN
ncbi:hypothetical protein C464_09762 [Halorubrum coriense DSM 10284]|uniref:Uncharacterized protein n=1 Tax=Halorubrum coriense DSM 10284 TaxID=1227466 RepID=M0EHF4_9EURY|nr:hypothetical protein C464_09762 [Halorubrum coriense DSM 10284]